MMKTTVPKLLLSLWLACAVAGCGSTRNVKADSGVLGSGHYRTLVVSEREAPGFTAMTAGKAGFGLIGAAAMISAGNRIVRENDVPDPARAIGSQLAERLSARYALQVNDAAGRIATSAQPAQLAAQYADSDLLLDVQTGTWAFAYFPTDWNNYRVLYNAKLRLVDTRKRAILAEGVCARVPEKSADAPSRAQLLADKAARLKAELALATDQCVMEFASKALGLETVR